MHVAVEDRTAFGGDLNGALLLPLRARQIIGVTEKLQIPKPQEYRTKPEHGHTSNNEQTAGREAFSSHGMGTVLRHRKFRLAMAPAGTRSKRRQSLPANEGGNDRLLRAIGLIVARRGYFRSARGLILLHLRGQRFGQAQLPPRDDVDAHGIPQAGDFQLQRRVQ